MRVFHLADLHLGKILHERDLLDDQTRALDAIASAAESERPACVIVAGDVFDRAVPPAEALTLFGEFVARLRGGPSAPVVVVIPGNHDSASRLSYMAPALEKAGVILAADPEACDRPIRIDGDGNRARIWAVPFLTPGAFAGHSPKSVEGDEADEAGSGDRGARRSQGELFGDEPERADSPDEPFRSQAALFAEASRRISAAIASERAGEMAEDGPTQGRRAVDIAVCHAFARGGTASESERVFLGNAELVDLGPLDGCDYVALGHLHRPQPAGAAGRYPGSPLAYSFSEAGYEHGFLSVDVSPGAANAEFRPITPLRRLSRLRGTFESMLSDPALAKFEGDYVEATLEDASEILDPMAGLRRRFPFALSVRRAETEADSTGGTAAYGRSGGGTALDDFIAFYGEVRGEDPPEPDRALFADLLKEASREAP